MRYFLIGISAFAALIVVSALGLVGWGIGTKNDLVVRSNAIEGQWAQVETQYQRRFDLIPNVLASTQLAQRQELAVYGKIAENVRGFFRADQGATATQRQEALTSADAQIAAQRGVVNGQTYAGMPFFIALVQAQYPTLQSDQQVSALITELEGTENRIAIARQDYNRVVQGYNTRIAMFPDSFIATMFGYAPKTYFKAATGAAQAPKIVVPSNAP